ncbi:MAG: glycosyltransferase [Gemmataceae bacterium]|nr:glycosyltransferase [Gemmataceae bacterium]
MATITRAQAALGADVRVICVSHLDRHRRDATWRSFAQTTNHQELDGTIKLTRVGRVASLARFDLCPRLPSLIAALRGHVDLVHLHVPNPTMLTALALALPAPIVVTYHSDVVRQKTLALAVRPFERFVFQRARAIFTTSPAYAKGSPLLHAYRDKVRVLPFGIDLRPFLQPSAEACRQEAQLREQHGQPLWLAVGRLVYYKGLEHAVRALAHVQGKLLVIGEGPLQRDLARHAAERGVAERIVWRGRCSDAELAGAYRAATALWFPSNARSEAFGLVQVEAMASGCPVINTAIPHSGVSWVSRHEETGLTVPMNDAQALAAAALRLLSEPGLRQRLSAAARHRAVREFDAAVMARRSLDSYRRTIARAAGA